MSPRNYDFRNRLDWVLYISNIKLKLISKDQVNLGDYVIVDEFQIWFHNPLDLDQIFLSKLSHCQIFIVCWDKWVLICFQDVGCECNNK